MQMIRLIAALLLAPFFPAASAALYLFEKRIRRSVRAAVFLAAVFLSIIPALYWADARAGQPELIQPQENEIIRFDSGALFYENETVYYTKNGRAFHASANCPFLARSDDVLEGPLRAVLRRREMTPCRFCFAARIQAAEEEPPTEE